MRTPDDSAAGLVELAVDPLRYDGQPNEPFEVAGILHSLMPSGVRVLDVGCGTGSITLMANDGKANDVWCVEPDAQRAAVARSRGLQVHTGYLDSAFLAEHGPFDVVMSSDVLEHMPAQKELLVMCKEALAPDGMLLVSVPNVAHWSVRGNLLVGRWEYHKVGIMDATHLRWFTTRSLTRLLEDSGFSVAQVRHTAGVDLPIFGGRFARRIPRHWRQRALVRGVRTAPTLFGAQHVVCARPQKVAAS